MEKKLVREAEFVEEMGLYFEQLEMPRMSGRILGQLLLCDPSHQSMNDLAVALQASKGSISTASRTLLFYGIVEKVKFAKDRQYYFHIAEGAWTHHFRGRFKIIIDLKSMAEIGLKILNGLPKKRKQRLLDMLGFYTWLEKQIPNLIKQWETENPIK